MVWQNTGVKRRIFRSILPIFVMVSKNGGSDRGSSDPHSNQLETLQSKTLQENPVDLLYPPPSYSSQSTPPSIVGYFFWWLFLGRWFWFFLFGAALNTSWICTGSHQKPLRFGQNKLMQKTPHCDGKALDKMQRDGHDHCSWMLVGLFFVRNVSFRKCLKRMNHWIWLKKFTHMSPLIKEPAAPTHCLPHKKKTALARWRYVFICIPS